MNPEQPNPRFPIEPVPPQLLEYARQTFSLEEFLAELRQYGGRGQRA